MNSPNPMSDRMKQEERLDLWTSFFRAALTGSADSPMWGANPSEAPMKLVARAEQIANRAMATYSHLEALAQQLPIAHYPKPTEGRTL